jgi:hypothetical protein
MGISLSYSACQKYLTSPFSYFAHYFLRLRPKDKGYSLFYGAAIDEALNFLLKQKMNNEPLDPFMACSIFCKFWTEQDGLKLYEPGVLKFPKSSYDKHLYKEEADLDKNWVCLRELGYLTIQAYIDQVMPKIVEVYMVQERISMKNADGDEFTGLVDFVAKFDDGKVRLCDNKSSSVKYEGNSASESQQLATYVEALKDRIKIEGVAFVVIPKKARSQKEPRVPITIIYGEISEELIDQTFHQFDHVLEGIKSAQFPCTPEICCAQFWGCDYQRFCKSGGKDTTGLQYLEPSWKKYKNKS